MNRVIGYCRVSTGEQNLDMQEHAIEKYADEKGLRLVMYVEKISSRKNNRTELNNAIKATTEGDIFVVYKLVYFAIQMCTIMQRKVQNFAS
ncbi:recombinase family protein [Exiguobacterium sp.]|uniref:recombinase family protein n=1 Tax=Exiguobacterium sp. TaxID=44751 RepID=UPI00263AB37A|nr:recombinase family protein [Exiguobacterium sp.]MCC5893812.1 recombinase family protein [Exiguobacterium sp.]